MLQTFDEKRDCIAWPASVSRLHMMKVKDGADMVRNSVQNDRPPPPENNKFNKLSMSYLTTCHTSSSRLDGSVSLAPSLAPPLAPPLATSQSSPEQPLEVEEAKETESLGEDLKLRRESGSMRNIYIYTEKIFQVAIGIECIDFERRIYNR